ncbi:nuclear transport factor 2 family protein [Streptomyces sp. NPDC102473]|uniref:nuclear transport factor 2 family protein n=1 Tax=Streptomyces sp. NPDC102473 TaxID=3366180 RepID=UPI003822ABF3
MDFHGIATSFVQSYYSKFDAGISRRVSLADMYRPESILSWESTQSKGGTDILAALSKPDMANVKHDLSTTDAQPSPGGGVLVSVTGTLALDDTTANPLRFSEVFNLQPVPDQAGSFFVSNQIFRMVFA